MFIYIVLKMGSMNQLLIKDAAYALSHGVVDRKTRSENFKFNINT